MTVYTTQIATALRLIEAKGTELTITKPGTDGGFNEPPGPPTPYTAKCVVLPASKGTVEAFDNRFDGTTLIETSLRSLLIAASGLDEAPEPGHTVSYEGASWHLIGATSLSPDGEPIIYRASMRRG
jgi:hypothetical protein